jgi:hypothetical protein
MGQNLLDRLMAPGNRAINAFGREQKRALYLAPPTDGLKRPCQGGAIAKAGKAIKGGDAIRSTKFLQPKG